ncbi:uncharacterized protein cd8b [Thalassophryne amazonica]|uniref:uncharacterized protein cd8b n=1 Tax=Thalassophryne amazonica TaxID=390379 RepID=UPI001471D4C7|nr:uncharacterized protein cd8b [Thalassophryne amazonica]XP_034023019.1 uncharacterized protein cd8b [Thalassophryne amazonica]
MILTSLLWTMLVVTLWTPGLSQILIQKPSKVLYPPILSSEVIECDCGNSSCDFVLWFRSLLISNDLQFLGTCNNANRDTYTSVANTGQFKFSKKGSLSFVLRIVNVTEEDAGVYSCVLTSKRKDEMWNPGILLRPGVTPPTVPPEVKLRLPVNPVCPRCKKKTRPHDGCLLVWPLVGVILVLAVVLVCTLYYFSRLPKKCRHQFVKKRPMTS